MAIRSGKYTIMLQEKAYINGYASVCGGKESEGPLKGIFDCVHADTSLGEKTWEKAEGKLQYEAASLAINKAQLDPEEIDFIFAGDLLNQCISSTFGLRSFDIPYVGVYGACSTMAETLGLASLMVENRIATHCLAVTSSHFCSAERQYRFPLEYGGQRTPTAQWTVTGSGAIVLGASGKGPYINAVTFGKVIDLGIKDANNMGVAMAPAATSTISNFLDDTGTKPSDYDLILTGDLGIFGSKLLVDLLKREGYDISKNHKDCGEMIFDNKTQDTHAGGSGCGCSATVLCSKILKDFDNGNLKNILFIATGALMSPTSSQQGETIPSIAHLINIKQ